jgi:hypothetical protein
MEELDILIYSAVPLPEDFSKTAGLLSHEEIMSLIPKRSNALLNHPEFYSGINPYVSTGEELKKFPYHKKYLEDFDFGKMIKDVFAIYKSSNYDLEKMAGLFESEFAFLSDKQSADEYLERIKKADVRAIYFRKENIVGGIDPLIGIEPFPKEYFELENYLKSQGFSEVTRN